MTGPCVINGLECECDVLQKSGERSSVIDNKCASVVVVVMELVLMYNKTKATYLTLSQTVKAIMDSQHGVTLDNAHPDCSADGSIHTSTGSTDVHDGHIDVALINKRDLFPYLFLVKNNLNGYGSVENGWPLP